MKSRYWPAVADLRLLMSRDGVNWQRPAGRHAFLRLGMEGDWDCGSLWMATGIVLKGDTLYQYYTGWNVPHGWERNLAQPGMGGVGLLRSRLDGFFSADASYTGGEILTIPVIFEGSRLELNIDTSAAGLCKVELQDVDGTPIPGYTLGEADTLNGNGVLHLLLDLGFLLHRDTRERRDVVRCETRDTVDITGDMESAERLAVAFQTFDTPSLLLVVTLGLVPSVLRKAEWVPR